VATIWGRLSSINVRKVVWAAQEVGLDFERMDAGGPFGGLDTPQFRALNPNQTIPVLQDGAVTLWESNTIVRYLCATYAPGRLYPEHLPERFDAERWMDWQLSTLNRAGVNGFLQQIRTPQAQRQPALIKQSRTATEALLAILDAHLGQRAYEGGAQFGMADIPVACEVHRWWGLPQPRQLHPYIERWYPRLLERLASQNILSIQLTWAFSAP
jgi:glutathione S-transferase